MKKLSKKFIAALMSAVMMICGTAVPVSADDCPYSGVAGGELYVDASGNVTFGGYPVHNYNGVLYYVDSSGEGYAVYGGGAINYIDDTNYVKFKMTANSAAYNGAVQCKPGDTVTLSFSCNQNISVTNVSWSSYDNCLSLSPNGSQCNVNINSRGFAGVDLKVDYTINLLGVSCSSSYYSTYSFDIAAFAPLVISPASLSLAAGETKEVTVSMDGYTFSGSGGEVGYSSQNSGIANVELKSSGASYVFRVTGVAAGTTNIIFTNELGAETLMPVTVTAKDVTSISLDRTTLELQKGDSVYIMATVLPQDAVDKTLTWSSSDNSVAAVDNYGAVKALKAGTAVITAKAKNGVYASCTVTVKGKEVTSVSLNKSSAEMKKGDTLTLTAAVLPSDADDKTLTWSSSNSSVASVDNSGKITAKSAGTATITVKTSNGKTATCNVTVKGTEVTSVSLNKSSAEMKKGDTLTLTAAVSPSDADDKTLTWSSSNSSVASVDNNGKITAKAVGTATITVKTSNGKTATCSVTVKAPEPTGVTVSSASKTITVGETAALTAKVSPDGADKSVTWSSSNSAVASVSASGVVTAKAAGTATITAKTSNGKTATCTVTIKGIEAASVTLNITSKEIEQGASFNLYATVSPANAADKSVTWSSSNTSVAAVDANGKVTAKSAGTATVTVRTANGKTASCTVKVPAAAVSSVTLDKTSAEMKVGETLSLTASVAPANAADKTLIWFSNNENILTVTSNGTVTAKSAGTAIVTAKSSNGKIGTCTIKVTVDSDYVLSFSHGLSIRVGETGKLEPDTPLPEGVTIKFEAFKAGVVSIASDGTVTGLTPGSVLVCAETSSGASAIVYITVMHSLEDEYAARKKFAEDVLYYVNIEREKAGVAPVKLMDELSALAQIRTDEQVAVGDIDHTRPDGTPWSTVFNGSNIPWKARSENLILSGGWTAESCVKAWMESPGHRANILRPNFTHMGIGVELRNVELGTSYIVTQIFIMC